ncbi:MAG: hypothetical protein ACYDG5_02600 [Dehalococcoidales bacterium]
MLKNKWLNFIEFGAPVAIGVGVIFAIVSSRLDYGTLAFGLGIGLSVGLVILGFILAPNKASFRLWAPAATAAGVAYLLYSVVTSDWNKIAGGVLLILLGFLIAPYKK